MHAECGLRAHYHGSGGLARVPSQAHDEHTLIHSDSRLTLGARDPAWYPVDIVRSAGLLIYLEGLVYGDAAQLVATLTQAWREAGADLAGRLRACMNDVDADLVALLYDEARGLMAVAGDRFGRIPLYYGASARDVIVSRSQRFISDRSEKPVVDTRALSQLLLLGYPLQERTLAAGISRLLPQEVIVAGPDGVSLSRPPASPFRAGSDRAARSFDASVEALRDQFIAACRSRAASAPRHVLSLSGGIDSRATGAGMRASMTPFSAVTFSAPGSLHADERDTARAVAAALGADWQSYEQRHDSRASVNAIIAMKVGLNPVDVAFGIDYVERVQREFGGRVALWTGEGADKLLCEHRAIPPAPLPDQLVRFIIAKNAILAPGLVARLTGAHEDDIRAGVFNAISGVHEVDAGDAYVHFLLSQRVVRFHAEGEDRHRIAVWPLSPFFAPSFVALARAIPARWKRGRRLYRAFMAALAPDMAGIALSGGHAAPASRRFALEYSLRETARNSRFASAAYTRLRRWRQSRHARDSPWHAILRDFVAAGTVPAPFDAGEISRALSGDALSPHASAQLLTAVMAVELVGGGARMPRL